MLDTKLSHPQQSEKTQEDEEQAITSRLADLGYLEVANEEQAITSRLADLGYLEAANEEQVIIDRLASLGYLQ